MAVVLGVLVEVHKTKLTAAITVILFQFFVQHPARVCDAPSCHLSQILREMVVMSTGCVDGVPGLRDSHRRCALVDADCFRRTFRTPPPADIS